MVWEEPATATRVRNPITERFWRQTLVRYRASRLSIRDFCRRQALSEPSFYAWRRELARRDQEEGPVQRTRPVQRKRRRRPAFVPVRVLTENHTVAIPNGAIEIILSGGRIVRVHGRFERHILAEVVSMLEASVC